jgi:energy-coupling factor transport system permease protein
MNQTQSGYVENNTVLHRLNPALKFFMLIILTVTIIIYPSWRFSIILLLLTLVGFRVAKIPLRLSTRRTKYLVVFSLFLLLIQVIVTINGTILLYMIPRIGDIGPFLPVTDFGVERGLAIAVRFLLIVFSSMLFISITDPTLLSHSLTKLGLPYRFSFAIVIALRFVPLFDSENEVVRMAQRSRGISIEVGSLSKLLRSIRYTFFPLLVSALSRAETLSISMDGRGFGYSNTRTYFRKSEWRKSDTGLLVLTLGLVTLSILLALGQLPALSLLI